MSEGPRSLVLCETATDRKIIEAIISNLGLKENTHVQHMGGSLAPTNLIRRTRSSPDGPAIRRADVVSDAKRGKWKFDVDRVFIVFDLEFGRPMDTVPEEATYDGMRLAPAVPSVEAWVLADPQIFCLQAQSLHNMAHIAHSDYLVDGAFRFFNQKEKVRLTTDKTLHEYSAGRASVFSPSLHAFTSALSAGVSQAALSSEFDINKTILSFLIKDYYPPNAPLYRTLAGQVLSGREMAFEIHSGSDLGKQYSSDLLRVCRDILARQARNLER